MANQRSSSAQDQPIIVEPPRARDVMALPLRSAFPRGDALPSDWLRCLAEIDAKTCARK